MANSAKVIEAKKRMNEFAEKAVEMEEGNRKRERDGEGAIQQSTSSGSGISIDERIKAEEEQQKKEVDKKKRDDLRC